MAIAQGRNHLPKQGVSLHQRDFELDCCSSSSAAVAATAAMNCPVGRSHEMTSSLEEEAYPLAQSTWFFQSDPL